MPSVVSDSSPICTVCQTVCLPVRQLQPPKAARHAYLYVLYMYVSQTLNARNKQALNAANVPWTIARPNQASDAAQTAQSQAMHSIMRGATHPTMLMISTDTCSPSEPPQLSVTLCHNPQTPKDMKQISTNSPMQLNNDGDPFA